MRCLSVCVLVTFMHSVKANKHIFEISPLSGDQVILVFPYQTAGSSNAVELDRNRDYEPISGFTALLVRRRRIDNTYDAAGLPYTYRW